MTYSDNGLRFTCPERLSLEFTREGNVLGKNSAVRILLARSEAAKRKGQGKWSLEAFLWLYGAGKRIAEVLGRIIGG